ncbi:uncharacterized protein [Euwallacea fornicatus]|uniref:uncharacterized protein isoform X2 n=1 Tax=Euwallacea fornicatus TaxID=995702 RepID=UPI00338EDB8C
MPLRGMRAKVLILAAALFVVNQTALGFSTEHPKLQTQPTSTMTNGKNDLVEHHYENLRHIIASDQDQQDHFRQAKKEPTIEGDGRILTLDELKSKCQHFSRLFGLNRYGDTAENLSDGVDKPISSTERFTVRPLVEVTRRPVFIKNRPAFIQKNEAGFYVTVSPLSETTTKRPFWVTNPQYQKVSQAIPLTTTTTATPTTTRSSDTTTAKPKITIKYTKYEPVILQKTVLTDGRVMYHWHRSLPTTPLELAAPSPAYEYPLPMPISQRNFDLSKEHTVNPNSTTSTTTERSSWLFMPFSGIFGGAHEEETTTAETITTPSTVMANSDEIQSVVKSVTSSYLSAEDLKPAQLKLVVPIHYDDLDSNLVVHNNNLTPHQQATSELQVIKAVGIPQTIPRFHLGYTENGYGLTYNDGMQYARGLYGSPYINYQAYEGGAVKREAGMMELSLKNGFRSIYFSHGKQPKNSHQGDNMDYYEISGGITYLYRITVPEQLKFSKLTFKVILE